MKQIIECVPNFSEGRNQNIINAIVNSMICEGVEILDVDPGKATNRTVVTLVGEPHAVIDAVFQGFCKASELIDMRSHAGEHPRMGAVDVCPLIPISNISVEETIPYAHTLAKRVSEHLQLPVYMYEYAQNNEARKNLAIIRSGEFEGFAEKIKKPEWKPDYGPVKIHETMGASVIGVRNILIAYNVNLNTSSTRRANAVAFDVREQGRLIKNIDGTETRQEGTCKSVKGIGWFIEEYGIAQVSMNLTNINDTPIHIAFDACCVSATNRGMRVTGSELVGLIPLQSMLDAGKYFLEKQKRSIGVSDAELIRIAIKSMGLDELSPFDPQKKIIEYAMKQKNTKALVDMDLRSFALETASESPAPGGGSISAYVGVLGAALGTMVANLSSHKKGWDDQWQFFSEQAAQGQQLIKQLILKVDEDTLAFNKIMDAFALPKNNDEEKKNRTEAIQNATLHATKVPLSVMELAFQSFELLKTMTANGNPNSISDAGVGALCARAAVQGAYLNVLINAQSLKDETVKNQLIDKAKQIALEADNAEIDILNTIHKSWK